MDPGQPPGSATIRLSAGCSAAWLARVLWVHEVAGSNPASPTSRHAWRPSAACAGCRDSIRGAEPPEYPTIGAGAADSARLSLWLVMRLGPVAGAAGSTWLWLVAQHGRRSGWWVDSTLAGSGWFSSVAAGAGGFHLAGLGLVVRLDRAGPAGATSVSASRRVRSPAALDLAAVAMSDQPCPRMP
jgi:hypothetical protein